MRSSRLGSFGPHVYGLSLSCSGLGRASRADRRLTSLRDMSIQWRPAVAALPHAHFVWIVLAMSSTFAGNLTLLGSMANLIVAERAGKAGSRLGFFDYLKVGVPVTVLTTLWGVIALSLFAVR